MWEHVKRVAKPSAAIVLTAAQPFTSVLTVSNIKMFKQQLIWVKSRKTNFLNAKKQHLRQHEDILVFYSKQCVYNPQGVYDVNIKCKNSSSAKGETTRLNARSKTWHREYTQKQSGYPSDVLNVPDSNRNSLHPTQKPIALMEYLIKTYSNELDTVLDFCMGSGTTGVACNNLNRKFIGIEKEEKYFNIAKERIDATQS